MYSLDAFFIDVFHITPGTILLTSLAVGVFWYWFSKKNIRRSKYRTENKIRLDHDVYNFCSNSSCLRCSGNISKRELSLAFAAQVEGDEKLWNVQKWFENDQNFSKDGKQCPTVFYLPGLKTCAVVDSVVYKNDVDLLESNFDVIASEFNEVAKDKSGWKINSTPSGTWSVFYLYNQGQKISDNTSCCPRTLELLQSLESFLANCAFGNACFSVLEPGSNISEHYGPCNVRIRCHLGLRIPGKWTLCVDEMALSWRKRECILFDDSYLHSVAHRQDVGDHLSRAVFMVDFWHYNVTNEEKNIICKMFPPT